MATSIFVAECVKNYLAQDAAGKAEILATYEAFCKNRIPNLQRMNVFNYMLFRSPALGPLGPLWQYLIGTGNSRFQEAKMYTLNDCAELLTTWDWGANEDRYISYSKKTCELLEGPPHEPVSPMIIEQVKTLLAKGLKDAVVTGKFKGRWSGLFRYYTDDLVFKGDEKRERDISARRCENCGEWRMLRPDCRNCAFCGHNHSFAGSTKVLYEDQGKYSSIWYALLGVSATILMSGSALSVCCVGAALAL